MPLIALTLAQTRREEVRPLSAQEYGGFSVWQSLQTGYSPSRTPGSLIFSWAVRFKNESPKEIGSATLRMVAEVGGQRAFESTPFTISRFDNVGVPHTGSSLPLDKTSFDTSPRFEMPARLWRTDTELKLEIVGATGFRRPDLHDFGHLFTKLRDSRNPPELIAMFQKDPSLLKVRNESAVTVALAAFMCCAPDVIRYVLAHGGNAKDRTRQNTTIMHMAAMSGWSRVMDLAKSLGGDPNARTVGGRTPLMKAIVVGAPRGWGWLLAHKVRLDAVDKSGWSAARYAISEGQSAALSDLVRAGVSPKARDVKGDGWYEYAIENSGMMDQFGGYGLSVDGRNPKTGATPLMTSARLGRPAATIWLLRHGANPNLRDKKGKTCYDYAKMTNTLHSDRFFRALVTQYSSVR